MSVIKNTQGRPTRQDSEKLHENLLQISLQHFLENGFQRASIEGIAKQAKVSKLTIYRQYQNKHGLFLAVIQIYVDQYIHELQQTISNKKATAENLVDIGLFIATRWFNLQNMRLSRMVIAEVHRLEGLSGIINPLMQQSRYPVQQFLEQLNDLPDYHIEDIHMATIQFVQLCVLGHYYFLRDETHLPSQQQLKKQVQQGVDLFLNGCRK